METEFYKDAEMICNDAIDLLLKYWPADAPATTYRDTLRGLNTLRDYFINQQ